MGALRKGWWRPDPRVAIAPWPPDRWRARRGASASKGCLCRIPATLIAMAALVSAVTMPLLIAAVAAWALYVIVTSRPGTASRPASEAPM